MKLDRAESVSTFDLIIIGGGITGAGIALDASLRGVRTLVIEKGDFAAGTSSKSTKLIHGGLRYLKQLEIGLVRESGLERGVAHNNIAHLVHPERMILPITEDGAFGKWTAYAAVSIYDFLAKVRKGDKRKLLNRNEAIEVEPLLPKDGIKAAIEYSEYRTDDARLTVEIIKAARRNGAEAFNYLELLSIDGNLNIGFTVECRDNTNGRIVRFNSSMLVSAAGPWVDKVRSMVAPVQGKRLHLTKGVHIVVQHNSMPVRSSIYFDASDGRMIFVIPRGKMSYIGTTDTDFTGDADFPTCDLNDVNYLLRNVNDYFDGISLQISDVVSSWAGLRPLIHEEGKNASELSRKDELFFSPNGMVSIAGGKLTGYRKMAKRVVDLLQDRGLINTDISCQTENYKIHADPLETYQEYENYKIALIRKYESLGISPELMDYLSSTYGKNTEYILETCDRNRSNINSSVLISEIRFTLDYESVYKIDDFVTRRSALLYFDPDRIRSNIELIIEEFSTFYKWTTEMKERERQNLHILISETIHFT